MNNNHVIYSLIDSLSLYKNSISLINYNISKQIVNNKYFNQFDKFTNNNSYYFYNQNLMKERVISDCEHRIIGTNCKKCGIYNHVSDPSIKTKHYESYLNCCSSKYLKHMRKRQSQIIQLKSITEPTYLHLQFICEKFQFTLETLALGIYIYAKISQVEDKDEKFLAAVSLLVASKGIQLDKRVPYLNRYQRYADKTFSQEDYEVAEKTITEHMNFDIQYSTFMSFIYFYLTNGFLFKSDSFHPTSLRYLEDDVLSRAQDFLKTGEFLHHHPEKLALSIIKEVRMKFRLKPWVKQLEIVSGFMEEDIPLLERNNILKPLNSLFPRNKNKLYSLSLNDYAMKSLQGSLSLTDDKIKSMAKKASIHDISLKLQSIKENSVHLYQHGPSSTLRNTTLPTNKQNHNYLNVNGEKIIPLNSFVNTKRE